MFRKLLVSALLISASPLAAQEAARIEIQPASVDAAVGDTVRMTAVVYDENGNVVDVPVNWFTSYEIGRIDQDGTFVAYATGERVIGANIGSTSGSIPAVVRPLPASAIELDLPSNTLVATSWMPLATKAYNRLGKRAWDARIEWASSDTGVAEVVGSFLVARSPGTTSLTARSGGASVERTVAVTGAPGGDLALNVPQGTIRTGDVHPLAPTIDGRPLPSGAFPQYTLIGGGAMVDDGRFVAEEPGEFIVVADFAGSTAIAEIEVVERAFDRKLELVGRGAVSAAHTGDLWMYKNAGYVGTYGDNHLRVFDISDPANPVMTDSIWVDARRVNDVKVNAEKGFAIITREGAANRRNGIVILDLADPLHPTIRSEYTETVTGGVHNTWVEGDLVYAVHGGVLHIIDVSNLDNPFEAGRWALDTPNRVLHDVFIKDGIAYLSYWDDGLVILDLGGAGRGGTPTEPTLVSRVYYPEGNTHVAWRWRDYVFVGDEHFPVDWDPEKPFVPWGYIHVFDVSDLENPVEVAKYEVPEAGTHNVWIEDDEETLYIGYYNAGLRALDVSGELRGELYRQGREVDHYITQADSDVRVPNAPMNWGAMIHNDQIFSADMNSGLWIHKWVPTGDRPIS